MITRPTVALSMLGGPGTGKTTIIEKLFPNEKPFSTKNSGEQFYTLSNKALTLYTSLISTEATFKVGTRKCLEGANLIMLVVDPYDDGLTFTQNLNDILDLITISEPNQDPTKIHANRKVLQPHYGYLIVFTKRDRIHQISSDIAQAATAEEKVNSEPGILNSLKNVDLQAAADNRTITFSNTIREAIKYLCPRINVSATDNRYDLSVIFNTIETMVYRKIMLQAVDDYQRNVQKSWLKRKLQDKSRKVLVDELETALNDAQSKDQIIDTAQKIKRRIITPFGKHYGNFLGIHLRSYHHSTLFKIANSANELLKPEPVTETPTLKS